MFIKKGFTLIEVLIVILILGIVMAIGSVNFRDFAKRQAVVSVKRQMLADIRAAQSDVVSGRKPAGCTGTLLGYSFVILSTASPASYRTSAICSTGTAIVKDVTLPSGISLTVTYPNPVLVPANTVMFKPLAQGTNIPSPRFVRIVINNTNSSNSDEVRILYTGELE